MDSVCYLDVPLSAPEGIHLDPDYQASHAFVMFDLQPIVDMSKASSELAKTQLTLPTSQVFGWIVLFHDRSPFGQGTIVNG
jgi:hypothetical protein